MTQPEAVEAPGAREEGVHGGGIGQDWERMGMGTNDRMNQWASLTLEELERRKRQLLNSCLDSELAAALSTAETEPEYDEDEDDSTPSCGPDCSKDSGCKKCYTSAEETNSK
jgi:hypothetical protein